MLQMTGVVLLGDVPCLESIAPKEKYSEREVTSQRAGRADEESSVGQGA